MRYTLDYSISPVLRLSPHLSVTDNRFVSIPSAGDRTAASSLGTSRAVARLAGDSKIAASATPAEKMIMWAEAIFPIEIPSAQYRASRQVTPLENWREYSKYRTSEYIVTR